VSFLALIVAIRLFRVGQRKGKRVAKRVVESPVDDGAENGPGPDNETESEEDRVKECVDVSSCHF
jgi:hypothetical protein